MGRTRIPALVLAVGLAAAAGSTGRGKSSASARAAPPAPQTSAGLPSEPAGADRCRFCHATEVEGYARSAMAHSLRRAGREPSGEVVTAEARITMASSSGGYWQRLESHGDLSSYRIDYVIGSGKHASGYLLELNGHLFQSPVAYYRPLHAYDLAPGYEGLRSPDFTRPVAEGCVFCHAGTALYVPGTPNQYRSPPFAEEAIGCERCHGSAEKHLRDPRAGTIINPRKLAPAARDSVCEQCHLLGVGRVLNPGMHFGDFRPGRPLEDVFTTYVASPPAGREVKFKVISHVEQLARSACARMSPGVLWCGTCHDPHTVPAANEKAAYFRNKCLTCHQTSDCLDTQSARQANGDSCTACHMPRNPTSDVEHVVFTDHSIRRRPTSPSGSPAVDADLVPFEGGEASTRDLGLAYAMLGSREQNSTYIERAVHLLQETVTQGAADAPVVAYLAEFYRDRNDDTHAFPLYVQAWRMDPAQSAVVAALGAYQMQYGNIDQAISFWNQALVTNPALLLVRTNLAAALLRTGHPDQAEAILKKALDLNPSFQPARDLLNRIKK